MERAEALKKLRKRFGKQFAWEFNPKAPLKEEREAAKLRDKELTALKKAAQEAMAAHREKLLAGDPEFQRLKGIYDETYEACQKNAGKLYSHKFVVGTANGMFFHVEAQGDSWEEIFEKLEKK